MKMIDLGLEYHVALRGVQSSLLSGAYDETMQPKHLRVGIDSLFATALGLCELLMAKGIFTEDEYLEYMRLATNHELAIREEQVSQQVDRKVVFR